LLTSRLIQDPPYFKRRKLSETRIDYIGLGLVALGWERVAGGPRQRAARRLVRIELHLVS
jgi:hypothetical protein